MIESSVTIGEYFYDGDGKRVKKVVPNGETTVFVYDASGRLIGEYSTVAAPQSPMVSYTTADHLGSPRILTDENGTAISRRDFMPYGEEIARTAYGQDSVREKFATYERDDESGLDYAQARYYSPNLGRFFSVDPENAGAIEDDPQSWAAYSYARNNPFSYIDPTGEKWLRSKSNPDEYIFVTGAQYSDNIEYYNKNYDDADGAIITLRSVPDGSRFGHLVGQTVILRDNAFTPEMDRCGWCAGHALQDANDHLIIAAETFRAISAMLSAWRLARNVGLATAGSSAARVGTAQVLINNAKGKAAEKLVAEQLAKEGNVILASQVSVRTSKGLRIVDHLIRKPSGEIVAIEVKSGAGRRNLAQLGKDSSMATEGGTIIGKNAPAGLQGTKLKIETVEIRVP